MENSLQISKEYLSSILSMDNIQTFQIQPGGTSLGDNYMSNLYCLEIETSNQETFQLIVKSFPVHPSRQDFLKKSNLFWKEYSAYAKLLPMVQEICPVKYKLPFPKFFGGAAIDFWTNEPKSSELIAPTDAILFLEDLRPKGFKMANRLESLDFNHVSLVIKAIANFHASTWAFKQKNSIDSLLDIYSFMKIHSKPQDQSVFDKIVVKNIQNVIDSIDGTVEINAKYCESLKKFQDYVGEINRICWTSTERNVFELEKFHRILPVQAQGKEQEKVPWKTSSHGDCWTNNILFRNSGEIPVDAILIDLQLINESSPVIDLAYFLYISTDTKFREAHLESILELYHDEFLKICKDLDVEPMPGFNLVELKHRFHIAKIFGFSFSMMVLPIILKESEKAVNLEDLPETDNSNGFESVFENLSYDKSIQNDLRYKKRILELVKELYDQNVL